MAALSRDVLTLIAPPDRIENYYETLGELGVGGYGVVKRCRRVKRPVIHDLALKIIEKGPGFKSCVLRPNKEDYMDRLLKFDHPNVTCYVDFLEDEKYAYMVIWAANKRFKISKFKFKFPRARTFKLFRARSRLYRSQILQVSIRWKAPVEIYKMHSFAPFSNLNFFVKNC